MKSIFKVISFVLFMLIINFAQAKKDFKLTYEQFKLPNGLDVILHTDHSDPIVAVAIQYHVGSNREVKGKTGFAHLFEHMMFQASQNVPQDQFFKKIQGAGGTLNGGTSNDGTVYFEVVPKNALEMVLWMEADRMGYLLPTVTEESFVNQQDVVQNEKRQTMDNNAYGQVTYMTGKLLYPEGHPYNWTVIGEMEDLKKATLEDVHDFYKKWYGPNNATLVIAGDIDKKQVKELVTKYFGDIKKRTEIVDLKPQHVTLEKSKRAYYEDNFARTPELSMIFPTINQGTKDAYALSYLGSLLSGSKKSPFYKVIVENKKLAPNVSTFNSGLEVTGRFTIRVRTFPNINLKDVESAINESFVLFEKEGFTDKDVERLKASSEISFYNTLSSALGKSFTLARYNEYYASPEYIYKDIENTLSVTKEDILNVYNKYIKNKNYVLACVVPKGQTNLLAENVELFPIHVETAGDMIKNELKGVKVAVEDLHSSFDRSKEPAIGPDPEVILPKVWKSSLKNKVKLAGIEHNELPLVQFQITIPSGMLKDEANKTGTSNILAQMFLSGTKTKNAIQLEEAIREIGSSIYVFASTEALIINVNSLKSRLDQTIKLMEEILLEPGFDQKEFERIKAEALNRIKTNDANPTAVASNVFSKLVYGKENILSNSSLGSLETVKNITIEDIKKYYETNFAPNLAYISIAGNLNEKEAKKAFTNLETKWKTKDVTLATYPEVKPQETAKVYFVDIPGARQSNIYIGSLGLKYTDPDFYKTYVMNYYLGGTFNSIVNIILREEKGYTYGARTSFSGSTYPGTFTASSSVMATATLESVQIFKDEITKYRNGISQDNLAFTKNAILKSNALSYETLGALLGMLSNIQKYNLSNDFVKKDEQTVRNMTIEEHKNIAQKYLHPDKMVYLVVGDAKIQMAELEKLGLGKPILLDLQGNEVK